MEKGEFYTIAWASTAEEAFEKAKRKALAENEECSIAKKESYIKIIDDIDTVKRMDSDINDENETEASRKNIRIEKRFFSARNKNTKTKKAIAIAHYLIGIQHPLINDIDKPAGVLPMKKNEWLFFGMAKEQ